MAEPSKSSGSGPDSERIGTLVAQLSAKDTISRMTARKELAKIGSGAVDALVAALENKNPWVRWEAAKTLGQIVEPRAADALADALDDENMNVRWVAGEALVAMGRQGLRPVLKRLATTKGDIELYEAAHHVLRALEHGQLVEMLDPVVQAFQHQEPGISVPPAAQQALKDMESIA